MLTRHSRDKEAEAWTILSLRRTASCSIFDMSTIESYSRAVSCCSSSDESVPAVGGGADGSSCRNVSACFIRSAWSALLNVVSAIDPPPHDRFAHNRSRDICGSFRAQKAL